MNTTVESLMVPGIGNGHASSEWSNSPEEVLRESERRFREMIDALPAAIYTTDAEGRLTHFNRAAVEFSGRTPQLGTDHWCVSWKLYYPDGTPLPHDECPMAIALKEGRIVRGVEAIAERPDGKRVWFTPFPTPLRDAEGRIVGGINMLVEITERKLAEQANALLGAIVGSSDDAIISKDLNGVITSWNQGAERLFGYTAEEAVGQPITILIPADRRNEEPKILESLRRGERVDHFETVRERKDGSKLNISLTISPVKDPQGRVIGVSKIARDITAQKRAEQAICKNHERLQILSEALAHLLSAQDAARMMRELFPKLAAHLDVDTYFNYMLEANGLSLRLHSYAGIAKQSARDIERLQFGQGICGTVAQTKQPIVATDIQNSDYDKASLVRNFGIQACVCHPLMSGKRLLGTLSFASRTRSHFEEDELDFLRLISRYVAVAMERVRSEEALQEAHELLTDKAKHLDALVQQRTAKLQEVIGELESFSYSISHDMRAPLRAMQSFAKILDEECGEKVGPEGKDYIRRIIAGADRMDKLILDVLRYSRVTRTEYELASVELDRLLKGILESYPAFHRPQAEIELSGNFPNVTANEAALTQCISNLLGNAVKFVPAGAVPRVQVWAERRNGDVRLFVQDNGIGIPEDADKKIFGIFQRFTKDYEGTGIGLAIVRKAVERMGGQVGYESQPGRGSTFWLDLKAANGTA